MSDQARAIARAADVRSAAVAALAAGRRRVAVSIPVGTWLPRDFPQRQRRIADVDPNAYDVDARELIDWLTKHGLA